MVGPLSGGTGLIAASTAASSFPLQSVDALLLSFLVVSVVANFSVACFFCSSFETSAFIPEFSSSAKTPTNPSTAA